MPRGPSRLPLRACGSRSDSLSASWVFLDEFGWLPLVLARYLDLLIFAAYAELRTLITRICVHTLPKQLFGHIHEYYKELSSPRFIKQDFIFCNVAVSVEQLNDHDL